MIDFSKISNLIVLQNELFKRFDATTDPSVKENLIFDICKVSNIITMTAKELLNYDNAKDDRVSKVYNAK